MEAERELFVSDPDPAGVLRRVHDGLVGRGRTITGINATGVSFAGGGKFALRGSSKPIAGTVWAQPRAGGTWVTIRASDAAVETQLKMLGFERRQYESTLAQELEAVERDLAGATGAHVQRHR